MVSVELHGKKQNNKFGNIGNPSKERQEPNQLNWIIFCQHKTKDRNIYAQNSIKAFLWI